MTHNAMPIAKPDVREIRVFHMFGAIGGGAKGFNRGSARVGNMVAKFRCIGSVDVDQAANRDFQRLVGVPAPNNNTLRWCTRQIKIDPMQHALEERLAEIDGQVLMITGVRQGESAIRDRRIEMSCGKDGWEGDEPTGDTVMDIVYQNGAVQPRLFSEGDL